MLHDPPNPLEVFRRVTGAALVLAALALLFHAITTRSIEWKLVALTSALWAFWGAGTELYQRLLAPAWHFVFNQLFVGGRITLADEIADLEHRLSENLPADREILVAIRLAEIYRRYGSDLPRSLALLDRLLLKYPNSRELRVARGLEV